MMRTADAEPTQPERDVEWEEAEKPELSIEDRCRGWSRTSSAG